MMIFKFRFPIKQHTLSVQFWTLERPVCLIRCLRFSSWDKQVPKNFVGHGVPTGYNNEPNAQLPDFSQRAYQTASKTQAISEPGLIQPHHMTLASEEFESAGVFRDSETDDIKVLVDNFTSPALAMALRDRETTLQYAAILAQNHDVEGLKVLLSPFLRSNVEKRRTRNHKIDFSDGFSRKELVVIQRYLHKMPRQVFQAAGSRASVVIPLCNDHGVASILFERRSSKVRTHKLQVCFPGGMLDEGVDKTIVQTSLREMEEELGIPKEKIEVLGILRCNWNEVASMTGIAVTPVVGFIGEIRDLTLRPNSDEVEEYFTVPLRDILDNRHWVSRNLATPIFSGGPHAIWGLTAYLLDRFRQDILVKCQTVHNNQAS
jgi:nudix motif 8